MAGTQFPPFPIGKLYNASPIAQPAVGSYALTVAVDGHSGQTIAIVSRNGVRLTGARAQNAASAVREARRNVRLARRCGGF